LVQLVDNDNDDDVDNRSPFATLAKALKRNCCSGTSQPGDTLFQQFGQGLIGAERQGHGRNYQSVRWCRSGFHQDVRYDGQPPLFMQLRRWWCVVVRGGGGGNSGGGAAVATTRQLAKMMMFQTRSPRCR
jgi:hypothetical protein